MFFPFDPYLLRRSARFLDLATSYNTWGGAHQPGTDASHISSDDELEVPGGEYELQSPMFASALGSTTYSCRFIWYQLHWFDTSMDVCGMLLMVRYQ